MRSDAEANALLLSFGQQRIQIKWVCIHVELTIRSHWPLVLGTVPIQLHAILVRIAKIKRLADAVVSGSIKVDARMLKAQQRIRQISTRRVKNGQMIEPRASGRRRFATQTFPRVEADMVVIATGGNKCSLTSESLRKLKSENATVEIQCALKIRNLQMDVTDFGAGRYGDRFIRCIHKRDFFAARKNNRQTSTHHRSDASHSFQYLFGE